MTYDEMMRQVYSKLPELEGKLHTPSVVYRKEINKTYITYQSDVLVEEKSFLALESILQQFFPHTHVSVRVTSPSLKEDFLRDTEKYKQVLSDFIRRNYPGAIPWVDHISWHSEGNVITLTFPTKISMEYMQRQNIAARLSQAVTDIFSADVKIELTVSGDQEQQLEEMRAEREKAHSQGFSIKELQEMAAREQAEREKRLAAAGAKPPTQTSPGGIIGRQITEAAVEMKTLNSESGTVTVEGDVFQSETKELKGGEMLLVTFAVTDYSSSILCKAFFRFRKGYRQKGADESALSPITDEERQAVMDKAGQIKQGIRVKVRGECKYDDFAHEIVIMVKDLMQTEKAERLDNAKEKRVELHMHTNKSAMDGMTDVAQLIGRAVKWGHPAVAVTDHGVLQAFPDAFKAAKGKDIKLIPGCEGYLIDDTDIVEFPENTSEETKLKQRNMNFRDSFVVLDFESTGLNPNRDRIIEIGAVRLKEGIITDSMSILVNPGVAISQKITDITGITNQDLAGQPSAAECLPKLVEFIGDCPIAAHNSSFDASLLRAELRRIGMSISVPVLDTLDMCRKLYPEMKSHKLAALCKYCGVSLKNAHRAVNDATATALCLVQMCRDAEEKHGITTLEGLNTLQGGAIGESFHIILLVQTQEGLVNLNRLVSIGHLEYFRRRPHMPRKIIQQYRKGLILGSACEAGELFRAVVRGEPWEKLKNIAGFYDYLEIQPIGNNQFMLRNGQAKDEEELRDYNRTIVKLGEELGKPVVATGDVHFLDPHNAINRAIIQNGMGYDDCDQQPPLYFRTTDEMLDEFSYLGKEKAYEVVVSNPRKIADSIDNLRLFPKHPQGKDTFQPVWEDAEHNIVTMTWSTAKELYGDPLPDIVKARLDKELKSIVGYGYCTLYNIAEKLVSKSLEAGYLVGSRGSVGSSLVARMCGITEVNALPPHYRCTSCRKGFFDVDKSKYHVGVDLPDKDCPVCGRKLTKDGFDIPFEVFLGFEGDKVPDIDLNFSGEFQNRAHHYVEELFGHDHVFRAGTISGLADKTAYGYVCKYLEERNMTASDTEKKRLAMGCTDVKKTTGQHPGGMVVVPKEYEIYQFTAVQHPADDLNSDFTTTHFDFNSMHDILVKLDCLGHDDPTMMHMLEELTGVHFTDVPLDDPGVRSLFHSPEALGVSSEDILSNTGTYGVPEFGTGFVRNMLDEIKPSTMEELIRISGLSHGTDVWSGNIQDIITQGVAPISECVCCRDDIMNYLMGKGVPPKLSFTTMESVRKGKGLKPEMEQAMIEHNVPEWFITSCKKIKYMFPKGHAVAYVTMSLRVAWFKLHYPQAYYASYFTIRGDGFDGSTMLVSPEELRKEIRSIRSMSGASARDKERMACLEIVLEMNMRGIHFLPVDLYRSEVSKFLIEDGNIRCPFTCLPGLGESVAVPIIEARKDGPFISIEDLQKRGQVSSGTVELLKAHGSLSGLQQTSQISMF